MKTASLEKPVKWGVNVFRNSLDPAIVSLRVYVIGK